LACTAGVIDLHCEFLSLGLSSQHVDIEDIFSAPSHLAEGSDVIADIVVLRDGMSIGQRGRGLAACGRGLR
jgi:hypothetical protein